MAPLQKTNKRENAIFKAYNKVCNKTVCKNCSTQEVKKDNIYCNTCDVLYSGYLTGEHTKYTRIIIDVMETYKIAEYIPFYIKGKLISLVIDREDKIIYIEINTDKNHNNLDKESINNYNDKPLYFIRLNLTKYEDNWGLNKNPFYYNRLKTLHKIIGHVIDKNNNTQNTNLIELYFNGYNSD
jgi:hypothetical protein